MTAAVIKPKHREQNGVQEMATALINRSIVASLGKSRRAPLSKEGWKGARHGAFGAVRRVFAKHRE